MMSLSMNLISSFNSNLVQLKAWPGAAGRGWYSRFNSNLVQLKEEYPEEALRGVRRFNSNLVQLKELSIRYTAVASQVSIPIWYN